MKRKKIIAFIPLCPDEGGRILIGSFYECPEYVSRISILMPYDFRVWTPSWPGWPTVTSPRSDLIVNLSCLGIGFVSQCRHAQMKVVKGPHISTYFAASCACWLLGCFLRCFIIFFFSKVIEDVLIYSKYH